MRAILTLSILAAFLVTAGPVRAELIHGFHTFYPDFSDYPAPMGCRNAFDFSSQSDVADYRESPADMCYNEEWLFQGRWELSARNGSGIASVLTTMEEFTVAPAQGYATSTGVNLDRTYIIQTGDGLYAKFVVREIHDGDAQYGFGGACCHMTIEYYVQTDGSTNLDSTVPTEDSSWGRIKSLYQ